MSSFWSRAKPLAIGIPAVVLATASCEEPPIPTFDAVIRVDSDPGVPLAGAVLSREGKDVATTDAQGKAKLTIRGTEGSAFDYTVKCPQDYETPTKPVTVILRSVVDKSRPPEYPTACPPQIRNVVVAVRAEGGPFLPVKYLNQKVATTDASGSATILLKQRPGDQFELSLDTSMKGYERMFPKNPVFAFSVKQQDDVFPLNAKFSLEKGKIFVKAGPKGPTLIPNKGGPD